MAKLSFLDLTGLTIVKDNILGIISSHTSNNDIHISLEDRDKLNDLHTHSNKSILDATTASYTTEDKALVDTITNYLPLTGGTLSGNMFIEYDDATYAQYSLENSLRRVIMAINTAGVFGFYDVTNSKWIFFSEPSGSNTLNGDIKITGTTTLNSATSSGNISVSTDTENWRHYEIKNNLRHMQIAINTSGTFGLWDKTNNKWLLQSTVSGNIVLSGNTTINGTLKTTATIDVEKTTTDIAAIRVKNSLRTGSMLTSADGFFGLWDNALDDWMIYSNTDKVIVANNDTTIIGTLKSHSHLPRANSTSTSSGYTLGDSNYKWRYLYAFSSSVQTSDRNQKNTINYNEIDNFDNLFDALKPCTYFMNGGDRKHMGFIAQDVEKAMNENGMTIDDLSFVCKDKEYRVVDEDKPNTEDNREYLVDENGEQKYVYGLKYTELHALEINQIQKLKKKVVDLNLALSEALARIDELERKI